MTAFVYKGLANKERRLEKMIALAEEGTAPHLTKDMDPGEIELAKMRAAKELKEREKELKTMLSDADDARLMGKGEDQILFKKGVAVEVDEGHELYEKLVAISKPMKGASAREFEVVSDEPAKRGPGRPKKEEKEE